VEGRGVAAGKRTAADLSAYICFEDESGQGLSPPRGRTWAVRGARPVVHVRGRGQGRVNAAGVVCFREGHRSHFYYKLHVYHGRKGEPRSFSWQDYRDLIVATHQQLGTPVVWVWDNLNVHLVQEMYDFAEENKAWLRVFQLPSYAPELNPTEGVWSLLKRGVVNFVATNITGLERIVKRKLKKIQYRPELIDGCLAETGLNITSEVIAEPEPAHSA
jgi:transposase